MEIKLFRQLAHFPLVTDFKKVYKVLVIALILIFSVNSAWALSYKEIKDAYYKSYAYERDKDFKNAIRALMPVYKAYPKGYTINLRLGWLYYLNKNYANSEFHYKKSLKVIPSSIEAMLGLSLCYMAEAKWKNLEELMYKVLKIDYYNYYGNLRLFLALLKQKKFSTAEAVARKMLAIYPTDVNFLTALAKSLYYQGKKKQAKKLFSDILILDPENFTAKNFLKKIK